MTSSSRHRGFGPGGHSVRRRKRSEATNGALGIAYRGGKVNVTVAELQPAPTEDAIVQLAEGISEAAKERLLKKLNGGRKK
jgi:hypothetical protein